MTLNELITFIDKQRQRVSNKNAEVITIYSTINSYDFDKQFTELNKKYQLTTGKFWLGYIVGLDIIVKILNLSKEQYEEALDDYDDDIKFMLTNDDYKNLEKKLKHEAEYTLILWPD